MFVPPTQIIEGGHVPPWPPGSYASADCQLMEQGSIS